MATSFLLHGMSWMRGLLSKLSQSSIQKYILDAHWILLESMHVMSFFFASMSFILIFFGGLWGSSPQHFKFHICKKEIKDIRYLQEERGRTGGGAVLGCTVQSYNTVCSH